MDKLKMHTPNKANENFKKLSEMFPNAVTETIDPTTGEVVRAIDKDILMQEISTTVVEGREERYQFTWADKRKAILAANAPISKTLRPCREESVNFDSTENLYIEGDNLEVLKLLQETYLGKVKMIYIDPPYNTGNDFVYNDDFSQSAEEYLANSGQYDEDGNRLVQNTESNGRFHTDWLNMIYPRLKLARDLLTEDGVIFISIDENEVENLKKICNEIFGASNLLAQIITISNPGGRDYKQVAIMHEYLLIYGKSIYTELYEIEKECNFEMSDNNGGYELRELRNRNPKFHRGNRPNLFYPFYVNPNITDEYGCCSVSLTKNNDYNIEVCPYNSTGVESVWRWGKAKATNNLALEMADSNIVAKQKRDGGYNIYEKCRKASSKAKSLWNETDMRNEDGTRLIRGMFDKTIFDHPKPIAMLKRCLNLSTDDDTIILDFFSGSATTAHAVMQLNADDGGHRKFIMVQLPEETDEKSEARKAGYNNICEIGKERIRRAGAKIKEQISQVGTAYRSAIDALNTMKLTEETNAKAVIVEAGSEEEALQKAGEYAVIVRENEENMQADKEMANALDIGFRVLKLDTTNMKDVYYNPSEFQPTLLETLADNIKEDRTPEDLLFQVMLDLGVLLSSKIVCSEIAGKKVFNVEDNYLIACFDANVTEETITAIAKQKPYYFVMRDSSMATDSVATNFEQIFATYSPDTVRKVL